ncbi:hypothetical protein DRP53_09855 [candidate division WOR-3 bacterium]|uniref:FMN-binding domain-containing protein n=1 Tax=candidate division WOR-3 bacterium TaxID=2052148 RepID=A0A660SDJ9_UNCW3|nr:MAG: hypothetical protein DRP53_09855 [candidate division WOR-3 bacterium]
MVYPEAESFVEIKKDTACYGISGPDTVIIVITAGEGFGGPIRVGTVFRKGELIRVRIISHSETPGYGSKITDTTFLNQIVAGRLEAITGATVSSQAVFDAVEKAKRIISEVK